MTVYNINKGIGWASSGVEYAQAYRANIFRELGQDAKFIFTDFFQTENLAHLTQNIGFKDEEIIWLYGFFTDVKVTATTYPLDQFLASLPEGMTEVFRDGRQVRYAQAGQEMTATVLLRQGSQTIVQEVAYHAKGNLIRKDYFSDTKIFSEYYAPKDGQAKLYQRRFFNRDGSLAYVELPRGDRSIFRIGDQVLYSKEELIGLMLDRLELTQEDVLILDRSTGQGQAVFRHKGPAKLVVVIHAEHYNANASTEDHILWNNFYDYQFVHADQVDAFISSTDRQNQLLGQQFARYQGQAPSLVTLPVGALPELKGQGQARRPFSLLTCSRLAGEKHIDWLVKAVALAKPNLPELTFDIYGSGSQETKLKELIDQLGAGDYIRLMGHHDLTDTYSQYEVYLTASTSEGFGLTLMEAIGSGLPIIGLDVPYGNQTFVADGENGWLIPRLAVDDADTYAQLFAQKLVQLYGSGQWQSWQEASYARAEDFLIDRLVTAWGSFLEEMTHDSDL